MFNVVIKRKIMGIYSKLIYPSLMERTLKKTSIEELRKNLLNNVSGEVLEIGFGTGLNLEHYPRHIQKITAIDYAILNEKAKSRMRRSAIKVDYKNMNAEELTFGNEVFDSVVSTFTFCSIPDIEKALHEIYRVLKPEGRLFFLEHGLSPDQSVRFFQNLINPVFKAVSCSLNRDMASIIKTQDFNFIKLEQFYQKDLEKLISWLYMGIAQKG